MRNVKHHTKGLNIAYHAWVNDHSTDFNNDMVIDRGTFRMQPQDVGILAYGNNERSRQLQK